MTIANDCLWRKRVSPPVPVLFSGGVIFVAILVFTFFPPFLNLVLSVS